MKKHLRVMATAVASILLAQVLPGQENAPAALPAHELPESTGDAESGFVVENLEVPEEFRAAYFAARPKTFLVDPQQVLRNVDRKEKLDFLNYHSNDSLIDLFFYVFTARQELPAGLVVDEWISRVFSEGRPAAVVLYFHGAPERAQLLLGPTLRDVIPETERRRALEGAVMQALSKVESAEQLKAFTVQMSIRTYWMEHALKADMEVKPAPEDHVQPTEKEKESGLREWLLPYLEILRPYLLPATLSLGLLTTALGILLWLKWRARYHFPDFEVEPRLGGAHAAGVGGVISFASSTVTPASQRDQLPEAVRRP